MGKHRRPAEPTERHVGQAYHRTADRLRDVGAKVGDTVTVEYISTTGSDNGRITGKLLGVTEHGSVVLETRRKMTMLRARHRTVGARSLVSVELSAKKSP